MYKSQALSPPKAHASGKQERRTDTLVDSTPEIHTPSWTSSPVSRPQHGSKRDDGNPQLSRIPTVFILGRKAIGLTRVISTTPRRGPSAGFLHNGHGLCIQLHDGGCPARPDRCGALYHRQGLQAACSNVCFFPALFRFAFYAFRHFCFVFAISDGP